MNDRWRLPNWYLALLGGFGLYLLAAACIEFGRQYEGSRGDES